MDVTLEKGPSGTWKVPKAPKRRLQPWQRLWLAAAVIYLLLLAGSFRLLMPTPESISRSMVQAVIDEVRRYDGLAFAGESPRAVYDNARSQGYAVWIAGVRRHYRIGPEGNPGFERIERSYRDALADLPLKRVVAVLLCLVAWLVPMALLYGFGALVEWIRRGTRVRRG